MGPEDRRRNIERLRTETFDVLILGGGINGAGVARDLVLRAEDAGLPLSVALVEQRQFASGTSGKNSQLIHGGLRYLKYLEFGLVRESLRERRILLRMAPHLVEPLPFLLPMYGWGRRLFYEAGLRLYDALAGEARIGQRRSLSADEVAVLEPALAQRGLSGGAIFYDCRVQAARFVLENVFDAARHGAVVANYIRAGQRQRDGGLWRVALTETLTGEVFETRARFLVDARGPWGETGLRLVRGSHLVFPKITSGERAIAHFDAQGRIVFFIPWGAHRQLTLVGTTDVDHTAGPEQVWISAAERDYLLATVRAVLPQAAALAPVSGYSSLRPLVAGGDGSPTTATREHRIWASTEGLIHIAGGKYTTYRLMSEQAADLVCRSVAPTLARRHVTEDAPLPPPAGPRIEDLPVPQQAARAVGCEMAQRLVDLLFVSTYAGYERQWDPESLEPYAAAMAGLLQWDARRREEEITLALRLADWGPRP
ncbi:MAG: glycerol-3-phosphate dehydrogenase/oxidase [Bryobacterales bacterium]|nr:glycerol-3-phosphate dehydrogenase/oxidase [Bryobacteraceae bacterium]MDW8355980.1 glycerol-3-phosphate dehydrogenase/oxidase [Bryobacterales bacterium]